MIVQAIRKLGLPLRGALFSLTALVCAAVLSVTTSGRTRRHTLSEELKARTSSEGLALVSVQSNWVWVVPFGAALETIRNPRDLSRAWFSGDSSFVLWSLGSPSYGTSAECPSAVIVEALGGARIWQLHGSIIGGPFAVSADGGRVAFNGTFKPPGTFRHTSNNEALWVSGLQYATSNTKIVTLISRPRLLTSISWSPDNNTFVYDSENRVYIYDIGAKTQRLLTEGSAPAWSPNGLWIAYRSPDGKAVTINPRTSETKVLLGGRKIEWGIHWSPDSRYVMVAEMKNYALDILHNPFDDRTRKMVIYRLEDGAKLSGEWFPGPGIADRGYYWVKDHRAFLKGASSHPTISPCNGY